MWVYPKINPIALQLGPVAIHWYGLMYLVGFAAAWGLLTWRLRRTPLFSKEQLADIIFYAALGIILGGRLGYVLFYDFHAFLLEPWRIFMIWQGGMSFHGGVIGVIVAMLYCAHKMHRSLGELTDFIVPVVPVGLAAGRIGNFINGELWGRVTDVSWGVIFPRAGELPRHPSQLYEFFLEGVLLFLILWIYSSKPRPRWAVSGLFLLGYSVFRFIVEFFREPDVQIGYVAFGWLTKGQLLSVPMFVLGLFLLGFAYRGKKSCSNI